MSLSLADIVSSPHLLSFEGVCNAAYYVGSAAYKVGSLALSTAAGVCVGVTVSDNINDPTVSKIAGIASGLLTTIAVFTLTNPFMPIKDAFLYSAASFAGTVLAIGAVALVAMAAFVGALYGAIIGVVAIVSSLCNCEATVKIT